MTQYMMHRFFTKLSLVTYVVRTNVTWSNGLLYETATCVCVCVSVFRPYMYVCSLYVLPCTSVSKEIPLYKM